MASVWRTAKERQRIIIKLIVYVHGMLRKNFMWWNTVQAISRKYQFLQEIVQQKLTININNNNNTQDIRQPLQQQKQQKRQQCTFLKKLNF